MSTQYGSSIATTEIYELYTPAGPVPINTEQIAINNSFGNNRHRDALIDTNNIITLNFSDFEHNFIHYQNILQGTNEYLFSQVATKDRWVGFYFDGFLYSDVVLGAFKIMFSDGQKLSLQDAVTQGYIQPLVPICTWTWWNYWMNGIMEWEDICNIIDDEYISPLAQHRVLLIMFKIKSDIYATGIEFYSNQNLNANYDKNPDVASGLRMFMEPEGYDLSMVPFDQITEQLKPIRIRKYGVNVLPSNLHIVVENSKVPIRVRKAVWNGTSWQFKPIRLKKHTS